MSDTDCKESFLRENVMEEIWKQIEGFEGRYYVSNYGRVKVKGGTRFKNQKHTKNIPDKILKYGRNNSGYLTVGLGRRVDGTRRTKTVHKLVALAFLPNPNNYPEINHLDENKDNNCVWNLEWCTHKYNTHYNNDSAIERGSKKQRKYFGQYSLDGELIKIWHGFKKLDRETDYCRSSVTDCCLGKIKTYRGYVWKYLTEEEALKLVVA